MAITANQSVLTLDYWKAARHLEVFFCSGNNNGTVKFLDTTSQVNADTCTMILEEIMP